MLLHHDRAAARRSTARSSTCRRWSRRSPATLAFVFLLKPGTGPVNTLLGQLGIDGPLWFNSPTWAKPSLVLLGLWGIGDLMIIFLAALLDVPTELLRGGGARRRRRRGSGSGTSPCRRISPVLLFAAITGVIATLQYFTQAAVAASVASGAGHRRRRHLVDFGYPEGSTLHLPAVALRGRLPLQRRSATPTRWPSCCSSSRSRSSLLLLRRSKSFTEGRHDRRHSHRPAAPARGHAGAGRRAGAARARCSSIAGTASRSRSRSCSWRRSSSSLLTSFMTSEPDADQRLLAATLALRTTTSRCSSARRCRATCSTPSSTRSLATAFMLLVQRPGGVRAGQAALARTQRRRSSSSSA